MNDLIALGEGRDERPSNFPPADLVSLIFVLSALSAEKQAHAIRAAIRMLKPGGNVLVRDYGANDHAMGTCYSFNNLIRLETIKVRFERDSKISERHYARQDGTRTYFFFTEELVIKFSFFKPYIHKNNLINLRKRSLNSKLSYLFLKILEKQHFN